MTRLRFTRLRCAICGRRAGLTGLTQHGTEWLCHRCEERTEDVLLGVQEPSMLLEAARFAEEVEG